MAKIREPKIITLDTETVGLDGALKRIAIYDGLTITYGYTFPDVEWKLIEYYEDGYMPIVYIHNLDFDARKIPELFRRGNVLWNTTRKINNRYAKITCVKYTVKDSFKILPQSLDSLSKDFELDHGKLDLWEEVQKAYPGEYRDKLDYFSRCHRDDPLYIEYLGYDVISLYELLEKLMEISKLAPEDFVRIMSTASLSRYLFKNGYGGEMFMEPGADKTDYDILTTCRAWASDKEMRFSNISYADCEMKIREAYCGGRTEVFTPVCGKAYYMDVNSLYPSVMLPNPYPVGYPEYIDRPNVCMIKWKKWLEKREGLGFVLADVYIPPQTIPPLPVKMGRLAFVTGYVSGRWTYPELAYAVEHCGVEVLKIHDMIHFKRTYPVFGHFVGEMYKIKEQATIDKNKSLRNFSKLILNTSYGWTGMSRNDKTALRDISLLPKWEDTDRFLYKNEELGFFEIKDKVMAESVQVQVAAYVTSYARLVLLDALRTQAEKGQVYYCDTDSIVCEAPMPPEMVSETRLGAWDIEHHIDSAIFLQPKVYMFREGGKENVKFKGITKARQKELDGAYYENLLRLMQEGKEKKITVEFDRATLPSLAVAQKRGEDPNQLKHMDKGMNLRTKGKRQIDYVNNRSTAWHMESMEAFERFSFDTLDNPPDGANLFGG